MLQQTALSKTTREKKPHQQDKYEGELNSKTKERHGKGIYHFSNHYFEYEGSYQNNVRQGPGVLKLANGTKIQANFVKGEIQGEIKATYANGSKYIGGMVDGERSGYGEFTSEFEKYKGQWLNNKKHGEGEYQTTSFKARGVFSNNKLNGEAVVITWDSEFNGGFKDGKKDGYGKLVDHGEGVQYQGEYKNEMKDGKGKLTYLRSGYVYEGEFKNDQPTLIANEFEVKVSFTKIEEAEQKKSEFVTVPTLEYELEGDPFSLEIRTCYQGPMQLDEVQPTADEIDKQVKAWQEANKKNKNPPPMPDFNQPRMKKPANVVVECQSGRQIAIELYQVVEGKQDRRMQLDYRKEIATRRAEIELIKKENAKKNEEEADKKKPGKKQGKGAGEPQLKVNLYKDEVPESAKQLKLRSKEALASVENLEYPDDFPVGKYYLLISSVSRQCYGQPTPFKLEFLVNSKGTAQAKATKKK